MRRWSFRILIALVLLLALGALAVQIVLRTDLPRRMVLDALHENTGLRFDAASLTTGWRGRTELRDLTVALPLERDPFITVPSLRITHTDLLRLAIFRSIEIDEAIVTEPHFILRPDAAGAWNVARAAAIVESVQLQRGPAAGGSRPIEIPALSVRGARIDIYPTDRADADAITYAPIDIEGSPLSPLAWEFEARLDDARIATGHFSPRGRWPHHVQLDIQRVAPHLEPWRAELAHPEAQDETASATAALPELPSDLSIAATWDGALTEDGVTGRLTLDRFLAAGASAQGAATVTVAGQVYTAEPHDLQLIGVHPDVDIVQLLSGAIVHNAASGRTTLSRLIAHSQGRDGDVTAQLSAEWNRSTDAGAAHVRWSGRLEPWQAAHEGALAATFSIPAVGSRTFDATVASQGELPQGQWDADLRITGSGRSWGDLAARVLVSRFEFADEDDVYNFSGLAARLARSDREILLTHLDLPSSAGASGDARGRGSFNLDTRAWSVDVTASNWLPPAKLTAIDLTPMDVHLRASSPANTSKIDLNLAVRANENDFTFAGSYSPDEPESSLRAELTFDADIPEAASAVTGRTRGSLTLTGSADPLYLDFAGTLHTANLTAQGRNIGDLAIPITGSVNESHVAFTSGDVALLGGTWRFTGDYETAARHAALTVMAEEAQVEQLITMLDGPAGYSGVASLDLAIELPQLDLTQAELTGSWSASNLHGHRFRAATGRGTIRTEGDHIHFTNLLLEEGGGVMHGSAVMNLQNLRSLSADVSIEDWPLDIPELDLHANASGNAGLDVDLVSATAVGDFTLNGSALLSDAPLADFHMQADILGRTLTLRQMQASALGGDIQGSGTLYLEADRWIESTADFAWDGLDLSLLAAHSPQFDNLAGFSSGTLTARRTDDPHAIEPIRIDATSTLRDARYSSLAVEAASLEAYLGADRLLIQSAHAEIAGGAIDLWGRLTQHEGVPFAHVHLTLDQIDLQQIADFMKFVGEDEAMPGRISGWGSVGGYLVRPTPDSITTVAGEEVEIITGPRLFGQAQLTIDESDLIALPGFATLYTIMNIDFGGSEPTGRGEASIRLENNALAINRLTYFNRGTDIIARMRLENIWLAGDSPISGVAAGVVRPLRDLDLPGVRALDRLFGAIQTDAASVQIGGTLADREIDIVPFAEVTGTISRILRGRTE